MSGHDNTAREMRNIVNKTPLTTDAHASSFTDVLSDSICDNAHGEYAFDAKFPSWFNNYD